jgi:hypothetical protein
LCKFVAMGVLPIEYGKDEAALPIVFDVGVGDCLVYIYCSCPYTLASSTSIDTGKY